MKNAWTNKPVFEALFINSWLKKDFINQNCSDAGQQSSIKTERN